ncbi:MAG: formate dehydrogenase accessory sulfurtransferase FdhD [Gemmatimonadaceae bacterium]
MVGATREIEVTRSERAESRFALDMLAVEEPLEIRIEWTGEDRVRVTTVAITMRTPGSDAELAAGFLFTEGILRDRNQIADIRSCRSGSIRVVLTSGTSVDLSRLERHSYTTSSCGMCGKTSLAALRTASTFPLDAISPRVNAELIRTLPALLRRAQLAFDATGGIHASALFDLGGGIRVISEDVGRHNALDKVIGCEWLAGNLPASERILIVSGRVSFELVQKAAMAGVPIMAAIGAPSSLAVELARELGMTLAGFVRPHRFNVYSGGERILACHPERLARHPERLARHPERSEGSAFPSEPNLPTRMERGSTEPSSLRSSE